MGGFGFGFNMRSLGFGLGYKVHRLLRREKLNSTQTSVVFRVWAKKAGAKLYLVRFGINSLALHV